MRSTLSNLLRLLALAALAAAVGPAGPGPGSGADAAPAPALAHADDPDSGAELIGRPAPAWSFDRWIRTKPLALERLRGKVVLLRWWTEGCHFCESTLPVIDRVRRDPTHSDLVVIGVFHPKPPHPVADKHVVEIANRLGFGGPIAVDQEWTTLERYWLSGHPERNWTSVSFLIGKDGTIRWVHGGGEYHPSDDPRHARCDVEYRGLEKALAEALAESAPAHSGTN